jgi:phage terminase large subunit GpA-like protein
VTLRDCRIYVSWARSVSTLADKAVRVGHANEIDKWEHTSTSKEADPLKLFSDRFKEFPSHKKIYESTPAQKQSSRIERGRLASTNCLYYVPCPKCWRYQTLKMDQLKWDKNDAGKSDKDLARRTARYVCVHCQAELYDEHRGPMMRAGVWVPEGCTVKDAEAKAAATRWANESKPWGGWSQSDWVDGVPLRDGRDAGYQLSSLYALSLSWGDIAAEWVDCQRNAQNLRNFINQWLAETWENKRADTTWEQLGKRLMVRECGAGIVPDGFSYLTAGIDKQATHYVYVVAAWDAEQRGHVVRYGTCETDDELLLVLETKYELKLQRPVPVEPVSVSFALIDSGYRPKGIHDFVKVCKSRGVKILPCRGSSSALGSLYRKNLLGKDSADPGATLVFVDTMTSQDLIEHQLHKAVPGNPGGITLFKDSLWSHEEFLSQLLNEGAVEAEDSTSHVRERWHVLDTSIPNDMRDALRYCVVASRMIAGKLEIRGRVPLSRMGQ